MITHHHLCTSMYKGWICSLWRGHHGLHKAYDGVVNDPEYLGKFLDEWEDGDTE